MENNRQIKLFSEISEMTYKRALERKKEDVGFRVEDWYEHIKDYTAKSVFFDLSLEEIEAIVIFYRHMNINREDELQIQHINSIIGIKNKIEKFSKFSNSLFNDKENNESFFVRLSVRSPKDGTSLTKQSKDSKEIKTIFDILRSTSQNDKCELSEEEKEANYKLMAVFEYDSKYTLKCKSADEAMNLILTSERVYVDLLNELYCHFGNVKFATSENDKNKIEMKVIIREWIEDLDSSFEFRCFVKDNQMTAISQYNHYILIPELQNEEFLNKIKKKLVYFWNENIKFKLTYLRDYIIDLALLKNETVCVIELNPFLTSTGAALFDWTQDKATLEGSSKQVEIRARKNGYYNLVDFAQMMYEETLNKINNSYNNKTYLDVINEINEKTRLNRDKEESRNICFIY